jgi:hypothetical protein
VPYVTKIDCPRCEQPLIRKTGGRCPSCGEVVTEHVARARLREKRIEQVVAVIATCLVLALFLWAGGVGLIEGIVIYAIGGAVVWFWGKGTFWVGTREAGTVSTDETQSRDTSEPDAAAARDDAAGGEHRAQDADASRS